MKFFMPDGDGGELAGEEAERRYALTRTVAQGGFWGDTFTERRVYALTSRHNGRSYRQRVGEKTSEGYFVLAIFHSHDEARRDRYVVQSLRHTVHVDPDKVEAVEFFDA